MSEEWITVIDGGKSFDSLIGRYGSHGPLVPGVLVEVRDAVGTRQLLIGDVNGEGGVCDDCSGIGRDAVVTRYKTVWRPS